MDRLEIQLKKSAQIINFKFYFFLKILNSTNRFNDKDLNSILQFYYELPLEFVNENFEKIKFLILGHCELILKSDKNIIKMAEVFSQILDITDLEIFIFSIKVFFIKSLLAKEVKTKTLFDSTVLKNIDSLSLKYDIFSRSKPYQTRVNSVLISLEFFNNLNKNKYENNNKSIIYFDKLKEEFVNLTKKGLEVNSIFLLILNESINQGITSDAGSNYESRVLTHLVKIGIDQNQIKKTHDEIDKSTEYDFFFTFKNKRFGISAKRTLRERYKQFLTSAIQKNINYMIQITLGIDLTEQKIKNITQNGVYLVISDEAYNSLKFLQNYPKVIKSSNFSMKLLEKLG